jgi:hypothetical protein
MSKSGLQARPIYNRKRQSIELHLTIVFAALAAGESRTAQAGRSARFVGTARRYRTIEIQAGPRTITAADPIPDELREALDLFHGHSAARYVSRLGQISPVIPDRRPGSQPASATATPAPARRSQSRRSTHP